MIFPRSWARGQDQAVMAMEISWTAERIWTKT